jgi:hypothetical protein
MSRRRHDVDDAAAELVGSALRRPGRDAEGLRDVRLRIPDHHRVGTIDEARVAAHVVAVSMGMHHDQRNRFLLVRGEPAIDQTVDLRAKRPALDARVDDQRLLAAEDQIEERRFELSLAFTREHENPASRVAGIGRARDDSELDQQVDALYDQLMRLTERLGQIRRRQACPLTQQQDGRCGSHATSAAANPLRVRRAHRRRS